MLPIKLLYYICLHTFPVIEKSKLDQLITSKYPLHIIKKKSKLTKNIICSVQELILSNKFFNLITY